MALVQSLRERLVALVSNDNPQSVYKRIVDHLQDLQRFHQELVRKTEGGVHGDPKTFEKSFENIKNKTLKSIKSLLNAFENKCEDYRQIIDSRPCVNIHVREIDLQTNVDLQTINYHVQNVMEKCIRTKTDINTIVVNHDRARHSNKTTTIEEKKTLSSTCYIKNMEKKIEYQNKYREYIIKELENKILLIEGENQATFASFSKIMSNVMNLRMKTDCIEKVHDTSFKMFNKVSNLEDTCQQIGNYLDLKIEDCKLILSLSKENWDSLISEWNDFQFQSNEISDGISQNTTKYTEMNKSIDELIRRKTKELEDLNSDYQSMCKSKQILKRNMASSEVVLEKLKFTLTDKEKTKNSFETQAREQDTHERILLASIKDLDARIDGLKNNKIIEFTTVDDEDYDCNFIYEFHLMSSDKLKSNILLFEEMMKKISHLEAEKNELVWLNNSHADRMKREKRVKEESQIHSIHSKLDDRHILLDLANKEINNIKVNISHFNDLLPETIHINNELDVCNKVLLTCLQNIMIGNHGKSFEGLRKEKKEISLDILCCADRLRDVRANSGQMEALLEERIQLLQDRMKAITAQREQIEQANRGLEEELNKLSKNFVKMANNVKVTDETEEEKTN